MSKENFSQSHKGDILVVEDLITNLKYIVQILKNAGYQVRSAIDGELALESVQEKNPDLIIMDIALPGIDGIEVCTQLKSNPETREIPIIFLSAYDKSEMKVEAFKAGGIDYITKPVEFAELLVRINTHLKVNQLQKELEHKSELLKEEIEERLRSEEDLLKERILLKTIIDNIPIMLTRYNPETKMLYLNKEFENVVGWKTEEVQDIDMMEKVYPDPDYRQEAIEYMQKATSEWREFILTTKSGKIIDSEWSNICLKDGTQIGIGIDITERKEAEEALKSSEEKLKILFDYAPDAYYLSDIKGNFIDGNKAAEDLMGYKREELIGKSFLSLKLLSAKDLLKASKLLLKNIRGKGTGPDEFVLNSKDGTQFSVEIRTYPVQIKDKTVVLGIAHDITNRKKAEEELSQYEHIVSSSTNMLALLDLEFKYLAANDVYIRAFKLTHKELIGNTVANIFGEEFFKTVIKPRGERCMGGEELNYQDWIDFPAYEQRYMDISYYPYYSDENKIMGFAVDARDITERKLAEEALKESEEQLSAFMESATDGIVMYDSKMNLIKINKKAMEIFPTGSRRKNFIGKHVLELFPDIVETGRYEKYLKIIETGKPLLFDDFQTHDTLGRRDLSVRAFKVGDGLGIINTDITERKQTEEMIKESEEKFKNLAENSPNMIFINQGGRIVYANKVCEELIGYSIDEFYHKDFDFRVLIQPEYLELIMKNFTRHNEGNEVRNTEYLLRTKSGESVAVIINSKLVNYKDERAILGIITDISERKEAEEKTERFSRIFEETLNEIFLFKADTFKFTHANSSAQNNLGYTMEELQKLTPIDIKYEMTKEAFIKLVQPLLKGEKEKIIFETIHQRKDQSFYKVEVHLQLLKFKSESLFAAIVIDITERKKKEMKIQEQFSELNKMNKFFIDRENRMIDLKDEINGLLVKQGETPKYNIPG